MPCVRSRAAVLRRVLGRRGYSKTRQRSRQGEPSLHSYPVEQPLRNGKYGSPPLPPPPSPAPAALCPTNRG